MDDVDFLQFGHLPWKAMRAAQKVERYYAYTWDRDRGTNLYLHRAILKPPARLLVDHANGDGLDNRRSNIRIASRSLNNANRAATNPTGFRGVCPVPGGRFKATISERKGGSKCRHLGRFATALEAARAYDRAAFEKFGTFARLNFPAGRHVPSTKAA